MKEVVLGIDIGGTFTKFGIVDRKGNCLSESFTSTDKYSELDAYLENLHTEIDELIQNLNEPVELMGVGIGAPNANFYTGTIENAPNLNWKGTVYFIDKLKAYFPDLPMAMTNDANAAAIGEMLYGGANNMRNFIVITLGTGLGSGIVVDGKVLYGHDGFAGELGHINVKHRGRYCGCGNRGCLETYASATGIKRTVFKLLAENVYDGELKNISYNDLTAKMIAELAKKGDPIALEAFETTSRVLGVKLADAVATTSPEAIFLLGGLAKAGDILIESTRKHMENNLFTAYKDKVAVLPSKLQEANAAVLGAAALGWNELR